MLRYFDPQTLSKYEYKVRPGQNKTMVKTVKNSICHVIAYTLNIHMK